MRKLKTIGIVLAAYAGLFIIESLMTIAVSETNPDYQGGFGIIGFIIFWSYMATMVGYRWFDVAFIFIPFYGIFWIFRIAYRLASLPQIDWQTRE